MCSLREFRSVVVLAVLDGEVIVPTILSYGRVSFSGSEEFKNKGIGMSQEG